MADDGRQHGDKHQDGGDCQLGDECEPNDGHESKKELEPIDDSELCDGLHPGDVCDSTLKRPAFRLIRAHNVSSIKKLKLLNN